MPSIQYQFRVNTDTDAFLFETLEKVPANLRSEFIRVKLLQGIKANPILPSEPTASVTHDEIENVLPSTTASAAPTDALSDDEIKPSAKSMGEKPPVDGNTKNVLPTPTKQTDPGLQAYLARAQQRKETREKLDRSRPGLPKK